jgi:putative hemolysin
MIYLILTFAFIVLQGVFAGMETGMVSLRRPRVEHAVKNGSKTAAILLFFVSNPSKMIATTLLGVNVGVVCSSLMAKKFVEELGFGHGYGLLISTCVMSVMLLSCEIIPKNWFRQSPFERCSRFAYLLYGSYLAVALPVRAFAWITDKLSETLAKGQGGPHGVRSAPMMMEDLRLFLRESEADGLIEPEAFSILDNAIDFHSMKVDSIKIPRALVKDLPSSASIRDAFELCRANSFSRVPVYSQFEKDAKSPRWIGIFSVYDAIFSVPESQWEATSVVSCLRPAQEIDGSSGMGEMLERARRSKTPLFIVLDGKEQNGIVTPEDVARRLFE